MLSVIVIRVMLVNDVIIVMKIILVNQISRVVNVLLVIVAVIRILVNRVIVIQKLANVFVAYTILVDQIVKYADQAILEMHWIILVPNVFVIIWGLIQDRHSVIKLPDNVHVCLMLKEYPAIVVPIITGILLRNKAVNHVIVIHKDHYQ